MVVDTTLYDILEVEPNATQEQISRAVRRKSLEHHPDRGGSHEMMQQVNAAKEILTDPQKRRIYDQQGLEGIRSTIGNENFPFPGFSNNIFDIFDIFNQNHRNRPKKPTGTDIKHLLKVSLEDLYLGGTKSVKIDRDVVCTDCNGTGCCDGIQRRCTQCQGTGTETSIHRMGQFIQQIHSECSLCHGDGHMIDKNNRCKKCFGKKVFRNEKIFDVNIVHGSQHGEIIKFIGEANQIPNGESGTLYIILDQEVHSIFHRNKDDLIMKMEINLTESLCGFQRLIKLLDGHQILINHPPGKPILPNSYRCLKDYGMPNRQTHSHGNLIIHFHVKFPEENFITTESQLQQLESILPPKSHVKLNKNQHYEEAQMINYDLSEQDFRRQNFQNGFNHHDVEDDDVHFDGHSQGVGCQTQ